MIPELPGVGPPGPAPGTPSVNNLASSPCVCASTAETSGLPCKLAVPASVLSWSRDGDLVRLSDRTNCPLKSGTMNVVVPLPVLHSVLLAFHVPPSTTAEGFAAANWTIKSYTLG